LTLCCFTKKTESNKKRKNEEKSKQMKKRRTKEKMKYEKMNLHRFYNRYNEPKNVSEPMLQRAGKQKLSTNP